MTGSVVWRMKRRKLEVFALSRTLTAPVGEQ